MLIERGASSSPIIATTAPIAAGGNNVSIHEVPILFTKKAKIMKAKPKQINPPCASAYESPAVDVTAKTGEIKAKLDPKYAGNRHLQMNKYKRVPIPFIKRQVAGST